MWLTYRVLMFFIFPNIAIAHTDLADRIDVLTHKITLRPDSMELYLERGRLFRLHGDYQRALTDYQFIAKFQPDNLDVKYEQGLVLLQWGNPKKALPLFDEVLKSMPQHPLAWLNRARAYRDTGDHKSAAADYTRALDSLALPSPSDYIETADNYLAYGEGHYQEALSVLDSAIERLGMLVQLQSRAVDVCVMQKDYSGALQRVDLLLRTLKRNEKWQVKKAELLTLLGRAKAANETYMLVLQSISRLPAARRNVVSIQKLEREVRKALLIQDRVYHTELLTK